MGGFECSTHRRRDGRRLDMIAATGHDVHAFEDYRRLHESGILTARDGMRWHLVERAPGVFDFSSVAAQLDAAERFGIRVIWDIFHYGYPDHIDIFQRDFSRRLADVAAAFAQYHISKTGREPWLVPVNEISFFSYAAGDIGHFAPFAHGRGDEIKRQMVRATIAAIRSVRTISPNARFVATEPAIFVRAREGERELANEAESYRLAQYEAFDMLTGELAPELGGSPDCLDIIGVNYYPHNQWYYPDREMIDLDDPLYRPFHQILLEVWERYRRPMFVAETGTEDERRQPWFRYVQQEYSIARAMGADLNGLCLYPIVNHPGWEDERHCHNGLWDFADESGFRSIFLPLAEEVGRVAGASRPTARAIGA